MGLLSHALNENENQAGRAGRMIPTIHPSAEPGAKRRKSRLSVRDDIRFTGVGLHLPHLWGGERQVQVVPGNDTQKIGIKNILKVQTM